MMSQPQDYYAAMPRFNRLQQEAPSPHDDRWPEVSTRAAGRPGATSLAVLTTLAWRHSQLKLGGGSMLLYLQN